MLGFSRNQLLALITLFILLSILSYINRHPTGDDAWFAEQSYWLQKEGVIRSEFFRGLLHWEDQLLVSHKLFLVIGAALIKAFGFHLPVVQFTGFIFFVLLIGMLSYYVGKRALNFKSEYLPGVLLLIFANRLLVKMSFENRPEMMLAALGLGSFLLINSGRKNALKIAFAGILAALAFLAHLNGVIFLIAGFVTLIYLREIKFAIIYSIVSCCFSALYFIDILTTPNGLSIWYYQFSHDPATQNAFGFRSKLIQLLTYPRIFFYSPEQIALSLLFLFMLWHQRKWIKQIPVALRVYSLSMFFSFWLITKSNGALYMLLFIPFMILIIFELYKSAPFKNVQLRAVMLVYLIIGGFGLGQIIYKNFSMESLPVSYQNLRSEMRGSSVGFVPLTFFFNEYQEYPRLLTHENYKLQSKKSGMTTKGMAAWAFKNKADVLLFDHKFRVEPFYPKAGTKSIPFYKLTFFDGRFSIYKSKSAQ